MGCIRAVTKSSFSDFQLFHYYSGWRPGSPAGWLEELKIRLTQPSLVGTGPELGNISRDPHGLINDLFKPGIIGSNLKESLLLLAKVPVSRIHSVGQHHLSV